MDNEHKIFIFGTPSDKRGFEYSCLDKTKLPGNPATYLDKYKPANYDKNRNTYRISKLSIDNRNYSLFVDYKGINPLEKEVNRGAYIAVGVLVESPVTVDEAIKYLAASCAHHMSLEAQRDEQDAFPYDFTIKGYIESCSKLVLRSTDVIVDAICQSGVSSSPLFTSNNHVVYENNSATSTLNKEGITHFIQSKNLNELKESEQKRKRLKIENKELLKEIKKHESQIKDLIHDKSELKIEIRRFRKKAGNRKGGFSVKAPSKVEAFMVLILIATVLGTLIFYLAQDEVVATVDNQRQVILDEESKFEKIVEDNKNELADPVIETINNDKSSSISDDRERILAEPRLNDG